MATSNLPTQALLLVAAVVQAGYTPEKAADMVHSFLSTAVVVTQVGQDDDLLETYDLLREYGSIG